MSNTVCCLVLYWIGGYVQQGGMTPPKRKSSIAVCISQHTCINPTQSGNNILPNTHFSRKLPHMYFPLRVSIPEPCHEDWQEMTPVEFNQRHCQSCDRVLTDFSTMTDVQIGSHLRRHQGKLCGRFSASQLDRKLATGGPRRFGGLRAAAAASGLLLSVPALAQDGERSFEEQLELSVRPGHVFPSMVGPDESAVVRKYTLTVPRTEGLTLEVKYIGIEDRRVELNIADSSVVTLNVQTVQTRVFLGEVIYAGMIVRRRSLAHRIFVAPVRRYVVWPTRQLIGNIREWKEERRATRPERQAARAARRLERQSERLAIKTPTTASVPSSAPAAAPEKKLQFTASPNPFTDHLRVTFVLPEKQSYRLELLTTEGKSLVVLSGEGEAGQQSKSLDLGVETLPASTYFLRLASGSTQVLTLVN